MIECDEGRLMQVMLGLQSNALKYTQEGHVKHILRIQKVLDVERNRYKLFLEDRIEDTGIGISKED
jgi:signal transduction histidine kinase